LGSRASAKPILCLSERNDEDTSWTHTDETKSDSVKNKFKSEDMSRVRQGKELQWTEVTKNDHKEYKLGICRKRIRHCAFVVSTTIV
jgi:hypothetical protein